MARLKITLPDEFVFSTKIPIRIGDINRGGHLGHESFLVIIEEAHERFLQSLGYFKNGAQGIGLIMVDVSIMYLRQGCYGQILEVGIAITDFTTKRFGMVYKITDIETKLELARANAGYLFFDYQQQSTIPVPDDFKEKFLA
ncbi:acyl-CoA thioesterase [Chloroflexota bacterium]